MNRKPFFALTALVMFAAVGCSHAEPEAALPTQPNFAEQRKTIENDPTMPPAAKQSALLNLDRVQAQQGK